MAASTPFRSNAELLTDALKTCSDQYANYSALFVALDSKAQAAATMAGVLLGAVLAFVPQTIFKSLTTYYGDAGMYPVIAVLFFAIATIVLALVSLRAKPGRVPFRGKQVVDSVIDLLQMSDDDRTDDFVQRHYLAQLREWKMTLAEMEITLVKKGRSLRLAQLTVAAAAIFVAVFVGFILQAFIGSRL